MNYVTLPNIFLILCLLLSGVLGLIIFLKQTRYRRVNLSFSIFSWACASWIFAYFDDIFIYRTRMESYFGLE